VITFRAITQADFASLVRWRSAPHAARWFEPLDLATAEAKYQARIDGTSPTRMHIVEIDGEDAGYLQHYLVRDYPDYLAAVGEPNAAGIDFLIGEDRFVGKGLGPRVIRAYIRDVVVPAHRSIRKIVSTPAFDNARSIRALEKAGFLQRTTIDVDGKPERLCILQLS